MANAAEQAQVIPNVGPIPGGEYEIIHANDGEDSIRHGWVEINGVRVEKSFLCFANMNDARDVHNNLSKLQGVSFLKSYFIVQDIPDPRRYWLAVDKIDCSLEHYCRIHKKDRWIDSRLQLDPEYKDIISSRLAPEYQDIIRDIIIGMCELHKQKYTHGNLSIKDIFIVNNKAKLAIIRNQPRWNLEGGHHRDNLEQDFIDLRTVFKDVLGRRGRRGKRVELRHFYKRARVNNWPNLWKLYFHPLLMAPMERFYLPVKMHALTVYPGHEKESEGKSISTYWIHKVIGDYEEVLRYPREKGMPPYEDNVWDLFKFVRNCIVHINEEKKRFMVEKRKKRKRKEKVEKDLSSMLPDSFNEVYDLFEGEEFASGSGQLIEKLVERPIRGPGIFRA